MEINELKAKIKNGDLGGWYIISGEEDYLKKYYLSLIRDGAISDETFALFNHATFDGADIDFGAVKEELSSAPMMSDYKLVEWKFADLDGLKESEKSALFDLFSLKEEYPCAIFVIMTTQDGFDIGTKKKPTRLYNRLSEAFDIINFEKSTDSQLLSWIKRHFDAEGVGVDAETVNALLFRSGRSMEVLNNEIIKLSSYAKANGIGKIGVKEVEEIASATVECDAFALSNAVIEKNVSKAFAAMTDLKQRRIEPPMVIAMLERVYAELVSVAMLLAEGAGASDVEKIMKFHPFKAKLYINSAKRSGLLALTAALDRLREIDASSKSGGISGYGAIEIFITQHIG